MVRCVSMLCAAVAAAAVAGSVAAAPVKPKPRLVMATAQPAVVHGSHFAGGERVRVSFSTGGDASTRAVRATAAGTLIAAAPAGFTYSPCGAPLLVTALGARGDRATLKVPQRECPSP